MTCSCVVTGAADAGVNDVKPTTTAVAAALNAETILFVVRPFKVWMDLAAGQLRPTDQLVDVQQMAQPGTLTVFLEPLYPGQLDGVPPGSSCIANAYTNNHDVLADPNIGTMRWAFLHAVDAVGLVHAMILRMQAVLLPVQTLVFSGH